MKSIARFLLPNDTNTLAGLIACLKRGVRVEARLEAPCATIVDNSAVAHTGYSMSDDAVGIHTQNPPEEASLDVGERYRLSNNRALEGFVALSTSRKIPGFITVNRRGTSQYCVPFEAVQCYLTHWVKEGYRGRIYYEVGQGAPPFQAERSGAINITCGRTETTLRSDKIFVVVQWNDDQLPFAQHVLDYCESRTVTPA
jgi:hypothetical protein